MSQCVGGIETIVNGYKIHTFLSSGNLIVSSNVFVEILVVAGGGSGGGGTSSCFEGGGGGAGGLIHVSGYELSPGEYPVIVGNGGIGEKYFVGNGNNGEDSVFDSLQAIGGGKGGAQSVGGNGGSGGGGTFLNYIGGSGTPEQGNNGGAHVGNFYGFGGGGGGAGQAGDTSGAGQGGDGLSFDISGSLVFYAGGGGGIVSTHSFPDGIGHGGKGGGGSTAIYGAGAGGNGAPNTGGGGAGSHIDDNIEAGDGGSGIIIIKYLSDDLLITDLSVIVQYANTKQGISQQLQAIVTYYNGTTEDVTSLVVWSSSSSAVTISSSGLATAMAVGTAIITATYTTNGESISSTASITVGSSIIPLKAKYSGGVPVALAEFEPGDKISNDYLSVSTDGGLSSNSDLLIPSQKAVKTYVDSKSKYPLHTIYLDEVIEVGERQEYVIMSSELINQGEISLSIDAILFIGTGIN